MHSHKQIAGFPDSGQLFCLMSDQSCLSFETVKDINKLNPVIGRFNFVRSFHALRSDFCAVDISKKSQGNFTNIGGKLLAYLFRINC
jgi:hypothetical protein